MGVEYEVGYAKSPLRIVAQGKRVHADGFLDYKVTKDGNFVPLCVVHSWQKIVLGRPQVEDNETEAGAVQELLHHAQSVLPRGTRYKLPNQKNLQLIVNIGTKDRPKLLMSPSLDDLDAEDTVFYDHKE